MARIDVRKPVLHQIQECNARSRSAQGIRPGVGSMNLVEKARLAVCRTRWKSRWQKRQEVDYEPLWLFLEPGQSTIIARRAVDLNQCVPIGRDPCSRRDQQARPHAALMKSVSHRRPWGARTACAEDVGACSGAERPNWRRGRLGRRTWQTTHRATLAFARRSPMDVWITPHLYKIS